MKKHNRVKAALVTATFSTMTFAVESMEVTVTAGRQEAAVERTSAAISVLTKQAIRTSGVSTLNEALGLLPGVFIARNGSVSSSSSIFLRGAKSNHTIVLLDGVRLTSTTDGRTAIERIPLAHIDRIELVRGGMSSLYGSDGIGGVIQIFTTRSSVTESRIEVGAGSQDTQTGTFSHTQDLGAGSLLSLSVGREISDGYDMRNTMQPDSDGYSRSHVDFSLSVPVKNWQYDLNTGLWKGVTDYDASFGGDRSRAQSSYLNGRASAYFGKHSLSLSAAKNQNRDDNYLSSADPSSGDTTRLNRDELSVLLNSQLSDNWSSWIGSDYRHETAESTYISDSFFNTGLFAGLKYNQESHTVDIAVRSDRDSRYGTQNTWGTGYVYQLSDNSQLFASYRTAFAGPSHQDVAYGNNPNLKAEHSTNKDIGMRSVLGDVTNLQVSLFQNEFRELIQYDTLGTAYNVGEANAEGTELAIDSSYGSLNLLASYTYTKTENLSEGGIQLLNRPTHMLKAAATLPTGSDANISLSVDRVIDYTTPGLTWGSTTEMPAYSIWALNYDRSLTSGIGFNLRVDNLFDKEYETLDGYNGRGRYFEARLNYTF